MKGFTVLHDRIVVRPEKIAETKTEAGIIVPVTHIGPRKGVVVAAGPGINNNGTFVPTVVQAKQNVLFEPTAGASIQHEGEDLLLMRESDIIAIL